MKAYEGIARITCGVTPGKCPKKLMEVDYSCIECGRSATQILDGHGNIMHEYTTAKPAQKKASDKPDVPVPPLPAGKLKKTKKGKK